MLKPTDHHSISHYSTFPLSRRAKSVQAPWGAFATDPDTLINNDERRFMSENVNQGRTGCSAIADGKQAAVSIDKYLGGTVKQGRHVVVRLLRTTTR